MKKEELVGYIQGVMDVSKEVIHGKKTTIELINNALVRHKNQFNSAYCDDELFFNDAEHYLELLKEDESQE